MICKELHKLPNDPLLRTLSPLQRTWVVANILADAEQANQALENTEAGDKVIEASENEFRDFSKQMKELANKQHAA